MSINETKNPKISMESKTQWKRPRKKTSKFNVYQRSHFHLILYIYIRKKLTGSNMQTSAKFWENWELHLLLYDGYCIYCHLNIAHRCIICHINVFINSIQRLWWSIFNIKYNPRWAYSVYTVENIMSNSYLL